MEALLLVQRNRIVDLRTDLIFRQLGSNGISVTVSNTDRELIPNVFAVCRLSLQAYLVALACFGEQLHVPIGVVLSLGGVVVQVFDFGTQCCRLDRV